MKNTRLVLLSILVLVLFVLFIKIMNIFSKQEKFTTEKPRNLFAIKQSNITSKFTTGIDNSEPENENTSSLNNITGDGEDEEEGGDRGESSESTLDELFTNLESLETKCSMYEENQKTKDEENKEKHKKMIQEILDIENSKINELTEIVNFYRQKYFEKMNTKNQCRQQTNTMLEQNIDTVYKNKNMFKVQDNKRIDIDLSSQIDNTDDYTKENQ